MPASHQSTAFVRAAPAAFVFLWSTGYVGSRIVLPHADPMTFTTLRFVIVAVLFLLLARARGARFPRSGTHWLHLAVSGVLIQACFIGGVFLAVDAGTNISLASLIAGTQPLLTALLAVALLGEVLAARQWAGFVIGFFGLALVVTRSLGLDGLPTAGLVACSVALLGITLGTLYQKRFVTDVDLVAGAAVQFAAASLPCALWAVAFEEGHITWNAHVIGGMAWLCIALSVGAVSLLLRLIREGAAARVSSLFYLVPPVTALQGYAFFGERLSALQIAGMALTALGVAMINWQPARSA